MTEARNIHGHTVDLQRIAVHYQAEQGLANRILPLYNDMARRALQENGVSFRLYPDVLARAHPPSGEYRDQITERQVLLHSSDELRYDLSKAMPRSGQIDITSLTVDFLRHQDDPDNFKALIFADLPQAYRTELERVVKKFSGERLPPLSRKLSQSSLFLLIDSTALGEGLQSSEQVTEEIKEIAAQLKSEEGTTGNSLSSPHIGVTRFMSLKNIGVDVIVDGKKLIR